MNKHRDEARLYMTKNNRWRKCFITLRNDFNLRQRERKCLLQVIHAAACAKKDLRHKKYQSLVLDMRNKLIGLANKSATEQRRVNASLRMTKTLHAKQSRQLSDQNKYTKKWKVKFIAVNNA